MPAFLSALIERGSSSFASNPFVSRLLIKKKIMVFLLLRTRVLKWKDMEILNDIQN